MTCLTLLNSVLDLSHNKIDDEGAIEVLALMPSLTVLNLANNPIVQTIPSYRKRVISTLSRLTYLDDQPVFPEEREQILAWNRGGLDAEREERARQREQKKLEHEKHYRDMLKIQESARNKSENHSDAPTEFASKALEKFYDNMIDNMGKVDIVTEQESCNVPDLEDMTQS
eukprot:Partr_v1_DN27381_c2_g1_i2_m46148 putative dynein, axonemal, assembly factor 1